LPYQNQFYSRKNRSRQLKVCPAAVLLFVFISRTAAAKTADELSDYYNMSSGESLFRQWNTAGRSCRIVPERPAVKFLQNHENSH